MFVLHKNSAMIDRLLSVLLVLIWIAFFGYLIYQGYYAVTIFSVIIMAIALSLASSNEN